MDQRRLKVGDIVDDYCPRERRLTDHAIVAIVEDKIRQTRCTACDSEHPYKEARLPRQRRKSTPAALYNEVLANVSDTPAPMDTARDSQEEVPRTDEGLDATPPADDEGAPAEDAPPPAVDEGPVHRPLIRATLPRPEGGTPGARQIPEFTVRHSGNRGRFREEFRGGFRAGNRNGSQQGQGRSGRPGGGTHPQSRPRHGRPAPHKKRSR